MCIFYEEAWLSSLLEILFFKYEYKSLICNEELKIEISN